MGAVRYVQPFCLSVQDHVAGLLLVDIQRLQSPAVERPRTLPAVAEWVERSGYGVDSLVIHQMLLWRYPGHAAARASSGARGSTQDYGPLPLPPQVCPTAAV